MSEIETAREEYSRTAKKFTSAMLEVAEASRQGTEEYKRASAKLSDARKEFDDAKDMLSALIWANVKEIKVKRR